MQLVAFRALLVLVTASLLVGACSKEPALSPPDPQDLVLVKKVTASYLEADATMVRPDQPIFYQDVAYYSQVRGQTVYRYDAQRRLTYVENRNPDRPDYTYEWGDVSLDYADNQLIYTNRRVSPLSPVTYKLNSQGYTTTYNTYDQDGYMTFRQDGPNATVKQTIVDGNITQRIEQNTVGRKTTTYAYDLAKIGLPDPEKALWGRPSRNLIVNKTEVDESFSGVASGWPDRRVTTYSYTFDALGRPDSQTALTESSLSSSAMRVGRELRISAFSYQ